MPNAFARSGRALTCAVLVTASLVSLTACGQGSVLAWPAKTNARRVVLANQYQALAARLPAQWKPGARIEGGDGMDSAPRLDTQFTTTQSPRETVKAAEAMLKQAGYTGVTDTADDYYGRGVTDLMVGGIAPGGKVGIRVYISPESEFEDEFYVGPNDATVTRTATAPKGGAAISLNLE